jgi:hypothetical protein
MGTNFRHRLFSIKLLAILFFVLMIPIRVDAATSSQTLTIGPDSINEVVQAGSTNINTIIVRNQGKNSYNYNVYAAPYSVIGENYAPDFKAAPPAVDITSWFHFTTTHGFLNSKSLASVTYTLNVPKDTPGGGYYAAVFIQTSPPATQAKGVFQIDQRAAQILYLQVPGPVAKSGKVVSWHIGFLQEPPAVGTLRVEDDGGIHFISSINVSFDDVLGNPKYTYTGHYVVLPHTIRRVSVPWPHPPAIGLFKVTGFVTTYGTKKLSTRYILVVSKTARIVIAVIVALIILASIMRAIARGRLKSKKSTNPKADRHEHKNDI